MNSDAYISVKLNNCSGIWFTKCISISVFIIENHFVTPFHQTNAQNRIRIISVFLKIEFFFSKVKNQFWVFWHFEKTSKVKSAICPVSFNIPELKLIGTGWRPGLRQYWNSSPEIRHFGSYLFFTDFKIEKSKYRHRKRRRNDSLYKFLPSNNFCRKIKIPRDKDAKSDVVLYEWSSRALLLGFILWDDVIGCL